MRQTSELVFATFLSPSIRPAYQFVASRVSDALRQPARLVIGESLDQLRSGEVDFAFICGLPYVRLAREADPPVALVAAPVLEGSRYGGRPVYFSDVIVPAGSPVTAFEELRGRSWACNGFDSHSGALVVLYHLLRIGANAQFFGGVEVSGSHQQSICRVAAGEVDGSAIDSQVLAVELRDHPELNDRIQVIASLGPSTNMPLVAAAGTSEALREEVREVVTCLGGCETEREGLQPGLFSGFVPIDDPAYDDIRRMLDSVETAGLRF
jgi:ABC-type phosphate/phosphonate transport system substrate-binding protein